MVFGGCWLAVFSAMMVGFCGYLRLLIIIIHFLPGSTVLNLVTWRSGLACQGLYFGVEKGLYHE
jgi:hypothetical protein